MAAEAELGGFWPQLHGPSRDNISTEKGLLRQWPTDGPKLLWKYAECGKGYAGVSIAEGRIYTSGDFGDKEFLLALDLDGKPVWKAENGKSWTGAYPGARTTPTYDQGVLYQLSPSGRLAALEAASGKEKWALDIRKEFGAEVATWAFSENVLVDGGTVFCVAGGPKGRIVALDKTNGKVIWANTELTERAAYCSPILITHNGTRQLITIMQKSIVSVDPAAGKTLWTHKHETQHDQNVTMPICHAGTVYASSGHGTGGRLLKLSADGKSVSEVWAAKELDNCHGGVILRDGCLFGSGCRLFGKGFVCVDFLTGKMLYNERKLGKVSITCADGLLYGMDDRGKVSLVEADRVGCRILSQFDLPRGNGEYLCHPVVCGGRLYLRHWNNLYAYDLRRPAP
jgi:outer membrane protein assembly factor BamB